VIPRMEGSGSDDQALSGSRFHPCLKSREDLDSTVLQADNMGNRIKIYPWHGQNNAVDVRFITCEPLARAIFIPCVGQSPWCGILSYATTTRLRNKTSSVHNPSGETLMFIFEPAVSKRSELVQVVRVISPVYDVVAADFKINIEDGNSIIWDSASFAVVEIYTGYDSIHPIDILRCC
jgi:hypothetical protein